MNQLSYDREPRLDTILIVERAIKACGEYTTKRSSSKAYPKNPVLNIHRDTQVS
jgi:hypothetical protein